MFEEEKAKDEIFALALERILEHQIKIEKHLGIIKDEYEDCYYDRDLMEQLRNIE